MTRVIDRSLFIGLITLGLVPLGIAFAIALFARVRFRRLPSSPVVEYVPPTGDIFTHGLAVRAERRLVAAAIVAMAVRGAVRVLAPRGKRGPVAVQAVPGAALSSSEHALLQTFRPTVMTPRQEARFLRAVRELGIPAATVPAASDVFFLSGPGAFRAPQRRALATFFERERERMKRAGLAKKRRAGAHAIVLSLLFLVAAVGGGVLIAGSLIEGEWVGGLVVFGVIVALFGALVIAPPPFLRFTPEGEDLRRHLVGLRGYIGLAEQERLRVLQSPEGALRTAAGGLTPAGIALGLTPSVPATTDLVAQSELDRFVLNERLLPYAILFRQEEGWQREFDHLTVTADAAQNMRVLGTVVDAVGGVFEMVSLWTFVFRGIGVVIGFVLPG